MNKAIFLDRDGVINELVYYEDHGIIDSPFKAEQFKLLPNVGNAINTFRQNGYKVIIVSNQPGMAKGHMSQEAFADIRNKMRDQLAEAGAFVDDEYYCLHHPDASVPKLKTDCECRKPKPGLLLRAAENWDIDLSQSWMIGDGVTDVKAGNMAGCKTILLAKMKCEVCHLLKKEDARPDLIASNITETLQHILDDRQSNALGD